MRIPFDGVGLIRAGLSINFVVSVSLPSAPAGRVGTRHTRRPRSPRPYHVAFGWPHSHSCRTKHRTRLRSYHSPPDSCRWPPRGSPNRRCRPGPRPRSSGCRHLSSPCCSPPVCAFKSHCAFREELFLKRCVCVECLCVCAFRRVRVHYQAAHNADVWRNYMHVREQWGIFLSPSPQVHMRSGACRCHST
jgi:hypothetical protein